MIFNINSFMRIYIKFNLFSLYMNNHIQEKALHFILLLMIFNIKLPK